MDYEAAKLKITEIAKDAGWSEDLSLRGEHGSWQKVGDRQLIS
jgi:hypothetical protein